MMDLLDDGTMDTVFRCRECGQVVRFSEVDRDASGTVSPEAFADALEAHLSDQDEQSRPTRCQS